MRYYNTALSSEDLNQMVTRATDSPKYSWWPAHFDGRRGFFYWGSDFIGRWLGKTEAGDFAIELRNGEVAACSTPEDAIDKMVNDYLANGMRYV